MGGAIVELFWALVGVVAFAVGTVGLAKGGELPLVRVPDARRPLVKFVLTLLLLIGMTLIVGKGTPDLLERVVTGA